MHDWQIAFIAFDALMALIAMTAAIVSTPVVKPAPPPLAECCVLDPATRELVPCPTKTAPSPSDDATK